MQKESYAQQEFVATMQSNKTNDWTLLHIKDLLAKLVSV